MVNIPLSIGFIHPRWCRMSSINSTKTMESFMKTQEYLSKTINSYITTCHKGSHIQAIKGHQINPNYKISNRPKTTNTFMGGENGGGFCAMKIVLQFFVAFHVSVRYRGG